MVLGFPCNQFGAQEPGSNAEIAEFAKSKYDVNFPLFAKVDVNGDGACDLYKYLRAARPGDDGSEDLPWNFTKFVVGRDGQALLRLSPKTTPEQIAEQVKDWL